MGRCHLRRTACRCLLVALAMLAGVLLYGSHRAAMGMCSRNGSLEMLHKLCALYEAGRADGNLCPQICDGVSLAYETCFNRAGGKRVVQARLAGRRLVLKSRHAELADFEPVFKGVLEKSGGPDERRMPAASFGLMVLDHVRSKFGREMAAEVMASMKKRKRTKEAEVEEEEEERKILMHRLLFRADGAGDDNDELMSNFQMNSLWSLVQQDEFLFLVLFADLSFFPAVYGACGHIYAEEYAPPGAILYPAAVAGRGAVAEGYRAAAWPARAAVAAGILEVVAATEADFAQPLHLCDVKPVNFGVGAEDGEVKAIDVDISFFDRVMGDFLEQPGCAADADCDFFDCHGLCNTEAKKCTRQRTNNNFQTVCQDIFGWKYGSPGLLRNPPPGISERVHELIDRCVHPTEEERVAKGSTTDTFRELHSLLSGNV